MNYNILVTLDSNYIMPLKTMLKSLFLSNSEDVFTIYLMHSTLSGMELNDIKEYIESSNNKLAIITISGDMFSEAPILLHYTKEMYFRLLAYKMLPPEIDRILYLDPDILVINSIKSLYETDLTGYMYAAAYHNKPPIKEINKIRLYQYEIDSYYNSGVLLMNLELLRLEDHEDDIYRFIEDNFQKLVMPDQDVLNAVYAKRIKSIDEMLYNYDARFYLYYRISNNGIYDMDKIVNDTVILHFCGRKKPWQTHYSGRFHSLYKHYEKLAKC
jgi:Lipopolysaccharide biosynthesis proteins, LPS:glycosyltransferases